jgi:hypothetical protein
MEPAQDADEKRQKNGNRLSQNGHGQGIQHIPEKPARLLKRGFNNQRNSRDYIIGQGQPGFYRQEQGQKHSEHDHELIYPPKKHS